MTFTMCYSGVILQEEIIARSLLGVKKSENKVNLKDLICWKETSLRKFLIISF